MVPNVHGVYERVVFVYERLGALELDLPLIPVYAFAGDGHVLVRTLHICIVDFFHLLRQGHHGREIHYRHAVAGTIRPELLDAEMTSEHAEGKAMRCLSDHRKIAASIFLFIVITLDMVTVALFSETVREHVDHAVSFPHFVERTPVSEVVCRRALEAAKTPLHRKTSVHIFQRDAVWVVVKAMAAPVTVYVGVGRPLVCLVFLLELHQQSHLAEVLVRVRVNEVSGIPRQAGLESTSRHDRTEGGRRAASCSRMMVVERGGRFCTSNIFRFFEYGRSRREA